MFDKCSSLSSLPDFSKWNINNVSKISDVFGGCLNIIFSKVLKE